MKKQFKQLLLEIKSALRTPTVKQKEAYGRLSHSLSAATWIGSVTVMFTETEVTVYGMTKILALIFWGMLLFCVGAILSKGE